MPDLTPAQWQLIHNILVDAALIIYGIVLIWVVRGQK